MKFILDNMKGYRILYVITLIGLAVFSYVELRRRAKLSGK